MGLFGRKPMPETGVDRAAKRLRDQLLFNAERLKGVDMSTPQTRQIVRQGKRRAAKLELGQAKQDAMKRKWEGGSAAIR